MQLSRSPLTKPPPSNPNLQLLPDSTTAKETQDEPVEWAYQYLGGTLRRVTPNHTVPNALQFTPLHMITGPTTTSPSRSAPTAKIQEKPADNTGEDGALPINQETFEHMISYRQQIDNDFWKGDDMAPTFRNIATALTATAYERASAYFKSWWPTNTGLALTSPPIPDSTEPAPVTPITTSGEPGRPIQKRLRLIGTKLAEWREVFNNRYQGPPTPVETPSPQFHTPNSERSRSPLDRIRTARSRLTISSVSTSTSSTDDELSSEGHDSDLEMVHVATVQKTTLLKHTSVKTQKKIVQAEVPNVDTCLTL